MEACLIVMLDQRHCISRGLCVAAWWWWWCCCCCCSPVSRCLSGSSTNHQFCRSTTVTNCTNFLACMCWGGVPFGATRRCPSPPPPPTPQTKTDTRSTTTTITHKHRMQVMAAEEIAPLIAPFPSVRRTEASSQRLLCTRRASTATLVIPGTRHAGGLPGAHLVLRKDMHCFHPVMLCEKNSKEVACSTLQGCASRPKPRMLQLRLGWGVGSSAGKSTLRGACCLPEGWQLHTAQCSLKLNAIARPARYYGSLRALTVASSRATVPPCCSPFPLTVTVRNTAF